MKGKLRTAADAEGQLRFMENSLDRLLESFRLEKEEAKLQGIEAFQLLRERSRCHYQPSADRILNDLRELRYRLSKITDVPSPIFLRLEVLGKAVKEAQAHFSGTTNRLLRSTGQITGEN